MNNKRTDIFISHLHCCLLSCIEYTYCFETLIHDLSNRGFYGVRHEDMVLLTLVLLKIIAKIYIINKEEEQDGAYVCVYFFLPSLFSSCWDGFIRTWRCN